jgi:hypothetical protein
VLYHFNHSTITLLFYFFLAQVMLEIGNMVSLFAQTGLDLNPPICASLCSWDDRMCHHVQLLVEIGSLELFAQARLDP